MPTRSGITYHKTFKCVDCLEFYQMINKNKCSYCTIDKPPSSIKRKIMIKAAQELARKMTIKEEDRKMKFIKMISRKKNDNMLFASFKSLDEDNSEGMTYLLAKDALPLYLEHPTVLRGHIVASRVFDWWNIKSNEFEWPGYCSCYYGNFNESLETYFIDSKRPLRLPHRMMLNTQTSHLA